eukprot:g1415.t1
MDETLDLVLARPSPLRDCSNEVEAFKTPNKRRSRGEDRLRRPSHGSEEETRPLAEAEMMSFDEMRKQLSLWQSHLTDLTAEHREAERLRQDGKHDSYGPFFRPVAFWEDHVSVKCKIFEARGDPPNLEPQPTDRGGLGQEGCHPTATNEAINGAAIADFQLLQLNRCI